ncbi:MAG: minichromosome maintenance protein MCM [Candidatus Thalassarchaeaceae archaeon]|jgi:replicative DNA helicase Mcm|nr:minichromosome maintenance protein MCM [Candidatus Thalassarchaeaceae archaeon]MDP6703147.1 minichromosome maintenance protein MCM [Candidatus Thalassarchaeaceae archaeon]MDP7003792.1 minichromosome maintenance protein MCM [Candidatus Thalassarchaeaceae archaeon]
MAAHDASARWRTFLEEAKESEVMMLISGQTHFPFLGVSFHELQRFDPEFADDVLEYPRKILAAGSKTLMEICRERGEDIEPLLRVGELPKDSRRPLREIGSADINRMRSVDVIVTKMSEIKPRIHRAVFKCESCGHDIEIEQDNERQLKEPLSCPQALGGCGSSRPVTRFELVLLNSRMVNNQWIEIQELPENVPSGAQPGRGMVLVEGDQVNKHLPGQRITANVVPFARTEVKKGKKTPLFDIVYHLVSSEHESVPFTEISISDEDKEEIISISKRGKELLTLMQNSIAPSVFAIGDMPAVKRSLALQLFGGVSRINPDNTRLRGDIHILLMGDPGVAKSQLLKYMIKISPRGKLASGGGVSGAGLTAAAVRDAFNDGRFGLEAGILPLSDRGLAAIDEFDKISEDDRKTMHPAMEQQEIHVSKGGINATLPARCSVLAAANPVQGRFSVRGSNISIMYSFKETGLPVPLASRFDIIWMIRDEIRVEDDERVARHILETRAQAMSEEKIGDGTDFDPNSSEEDQIISIGVDNKEYLTTDFLRKYIAYAKRNVHPKIDKKAKEKILEYYTATRVSFGKIDDNLGGSDVVPITARALESLIRLTEAHARMHLRDIADEEDAKMAIGVYKHWRQESNITDAAEIHSGVSSSTRRANTTIRSIIRELCREKGHAERLEIYNLALPKSIPEHVVDEVISKMQTSGELYSPRLDRFEFAR